MTTVLEPETAIPPAGKTGQMSTLDSSGDSKFSWDRNSPAEVEAARKHFDELVGKRTHVAYRVDAKGRQGDKLTTFDPNAENIILVPQHQGG